MARFASRNFVGSAILASTVVASAFCMAQTAASAPTVDNQYVPVKAQDSDAALPDAAIVVTLPAAHAPLLITQTVDLSKYVLIESGRAPEAEGLKDLGAAPADMRMTLQLELRRSDEQQKSLETFKQHAGTPGDNGFGATMTPAEFASAFGLAASDLDALRSYLLDAGLTLGNIDNGRLTINFSGTVDQVNAALLTSIHLYEDADGEEHYGPVDGWQVPEALSPAIAAIQGLDNFSVPSLRSFNGPVVDFAAGTTGRLATSSEWPTTAPAARLEGELLHDASFTASKTSMLFGDTTRLNIRIGGGEAPATGSLQITDQTGAKVAYIADITACEPYNNGKGRSCTLDYTPATAGRSVLSALYSGDPSYRAVTQSDVIAHAGTGASVTAASYSPVEYLAASTAGTIYTSISWLGTGTQPTGTIVVESNATPTDTFGTITLPTAGSTTVTAGTACTTAPLGSYACTYGCTGSLTSQYLTCTITNTNLYTDDASTQANEQQAVYSGDTNYASSTGLTDIYKAATTPSGTPTISASAPTPATITYGAATTESNTLTITGNATQGALYTALLAPFAETTNPQLGTMGEAAVSSCTLATGVCTYANSFTVPANANPATYTVTYSYSGKGGTTTGYMQASTTGSITVSQQAPTATMVTPRGTGGNQENDTYGALTNFTVSGDLAWIGTGAAPTASDVTFTSTAAGSFSTVSCALTSGSSPYVCTSTFSPTASDTVNTYAINLNFSGDTNYSSAVSAQTANYSINKATPTFGTMTFAPAASETYGDAQGIDIIDTLAYTGSLAPTGNVKFNLNSTNYLATCTGSSSPLTCTAGVPAATIEALPIAAYTVTAASAADNNYTAATGTSGTFTITQATVTAVMVTPKNAGANQESQVYGALAAFAVSGTVTWTSVGTVPTVGDISFTSTAAGSFGTLTCTGSSSPYTCSSTFTPTSTDAVNTYGINISFSGDTNYSSAVSAQTQNYAITGATPTLVLTPGPVTSVYGSTTPITITATATGVAGGTTPGGVVTFTTKAAVLGTLSSPTCTLSGGVCTVNYTPSASQAVGIITSGFSATEAASGNYIASAAATRDLHTTIATGTLALVAGTPGSSATGVTSTTLNATLSPAASGATVTFTDVTTGATIGSATTNAGGLATITVNTTGTGSGQSATPAGGLNNFSASAAATTDTTAASTTSNTPTYYQGILFSTTGPHDFSGLITDGSLTVEGTVDGTRLGPFGVSVYNFTTASQPLPLTLTNAASGAFSVTNQCMNPLPAGAVCSFNFYYAPPAGDGCNPNIPPGSGGCTLDGSGYPQGTFESAPWSVAVTSGVLTGIGDQQFDRSGAATPAGTLEGKAILAAGVLNVGPTTAAFGSVAQNATSPTLTIVVSNTSAAAVPFVYAGPSSGKFTVNDTCNTPLAANASCNIYLTMVTTATGTFSDSLTITPSGGVVSTVTISGTVSAASSGITLSSNNHNFGSITDGTSVVFSTTLTNNTGSAASLSFSNAAGTGFTVSTNCGASLAASASCTYGFTFAPTSTGASSDTLTITSDVPILPGSGSDTGTVTVSGTGVTGGQLTATSVTHNWGSLAVGTSGGNYGVEITNSTSSTVTLSFSGLTGGSSGFSLVGSSCGSSLAVNANCELIFSFTPTATGFVTGAYPITSSSPLYFNGSAVSPSQITLKGTGD